MIPVFLFFCDELRADALGCYGGADAQTPHFDAFAADATRFDQAFSVNPICVPARSCLATGKYSSAHGALDNALKMNAPDETWYNHLRRLGYRTCNYGKLHLNWDSNRSGDAVGFDELRYFNDGCRPFGLNDISARRAAGDVRRLRGETPLVYAGTRPGPSEESEPAQAVRASVARLKELAHEGQTPLFVTSVDYPHTPYVASAEFRRRFDHRRLTPRHFPMRMADRPMFHRHFYINRAMDLLAEEDYLLCQASYLSRVCELDHYFGEWIQYLRDGGWYDRSLIIVVADHGTCLGEHGLIEKNSYLFDQNVRIPLMVRFPGGERAGVAPTGFAEIQDIFPTVLSAVGRPDLVPDDGHGRDLRPLADGAGGDRDIVFSEWYYGALTREPAVMARTRTHKITLFPDWEFLYESLSMNYSKYSDFWADPAPAGELYDLESDPRETANRFDDPALADVKRKLTEAIEAWKRRAVRCDYASICSEKPRAWSMGRFYEGKNLTRLSTSVEDMPDRLEAAQSD